MSEQVTIERRFRGPPDSGNGGYSVGVVAERIGLQAEVTLKAPPPLDSPLDIVERDGLVTIEKDGALIAEGRESHAEIEVPAAVGWDQAVEAARSYIGFEGKTFMECFVCGPNRDEGDGLRIFAGEVSGREVVAAPWMPDASLTDDEGLVAERFLWSALDCPTFFACVSAFGESMSLLGRLNGQIFQQPPADTPLVVMSWPVSRDGRKQFADSAVLAQEGTPLAVARATWIELRSRPGPDYVDAGPITSAGR